MFSSLSDKISSIKSKNINKTDFFELVLCYSAECIATAMIANEALLLPDLYRKFKETVSSEKKKSPHLVITPDELPSNRWFISRLNHYFGDMIVFECRLRHVGTVVFHKNCDLLATSPHYSSGKAKQS